MKKYFCMLLTLLLLMAMIAPAGAAEQKTASLIMDFETGQILHAENIDTPLPPASITKQ